MTTPWTIVLIMLALSAFFSGLETAFLTSNKLRIELLSKRSVFPAQILSFFIKNSSHYISTMLVGNCIALVVFSIFMAQILEPHLHAYIESDVLILLLTTLLSTIFILVTAEFLPKNLFRINPNRILSVFAVPLLLVYLTLYPIVFITNKLALFFLRFAFGTKFPEKELSFGRIDLVHYIHESTSVAAHRQELENEVKIFKRALGFSKVKARDCMIPRTEIAAIHVDDSVENLKKMFIDTRLSKILIYRGGVDNIMGYTHSAEIFKKPSTILSILLPVLIVPESMPANEVLTLFIQQHKSVALIVDEFGGTAGMLTMEDIIEEIFGEIEDEHDKEEMTEQKISNNEFVFSGRLEIDYINEKYKLSLPVSDEYTTLGGFILHIRQHIPKQNEIIMMSPYYFKILTTSDTTIDQIQVKIIG
ncbi:MAG: HlyC/CorC family transporter [Bacteroidetes bacterium]|nr:MAG: HlyC/CorC family transporter [Bacteroidota bacterium]